MVAEDSLPLFSVFSALDEILQLHSSMLFADCVTHLLLAAWPNTGIKEIKK